MQISQIMEKYQIDAARPEEALSAGVFQDPCEELFFRRYLQELYEIRGTAPEIRSILKDQGPEAADAAFHPLFFSLPRSEPESFTSEEYESEAEALAACLARFEQSRMIRVTDYSFSEQKKGLFSKKSFQCTVFYQGMRWNSFEETAREMGFAFLRCRRPDPQKALAYLHLCREKDPELLLAVAQNPWAAPEERQEALQRARTEVQTGAARGDVRAAGLYAGMILAENPEAAARFAEIAASARQPEGLFVKGYCLEQGLGGVRQNAAEAVQCYGAAADAGIEEAQRALARIYQDGADGIAPDPDRAFSYYLQSAEQGNAESQYRTAIAFEEGIGTEKDPTQAAEFYQLAAEKGHLQAQLAAARCCGEGIGIKKAPEKALGYYRMAAEKGSTEALYQIGKYYSETPGGGRNTDKAFTYFQKAADAGHAEAQYQVAVCYMEGKGVGKSRKEALRFLELSAAQGSRKAMKKLYYLKGRQSREEQNPEEAFSYLLHLAEDGNPSALTKAGMAYMLGNGVEQDYQKAFSCFQKASDQGFREASYRLGLCYKKGIGTEADASAALHYFRIASGQGHLKAFDEALELEEQLKELEESGRVCKEIELLAREKNYGRIFSLIREFGEILKGKEEVRIALKTYIRDKVKTEQTKEGGPEPEIAYIRHLPEHYRLPEGLQAAEVFYHVAQDFDEQEAFPEAITAYYYAALQGSKKAAANLTNMAVRQSRYFLTKEESYLELE